MCVCLVSHSCPPLCNPIDCSLPGSFVHGDSPGQNTGMSCHARLQGIFPTQGSNPGLPHCRWILNHWTIREVQPLCMQCAVLCLVTQPCSTLCDPVDCNNPPGSSVCGILQAKILQWVAMSSSRGSSPLRDPTQVSHTAG